MTEDEPAGLLTNEQLDDLAFEIPHIKAWVAAVETEIETQLMLGVEFKNAKLVPKRATRKWTIDAQEIIRKLRKFARLDDIAPRVPLSPAAFEKALGRAKLAEVKDFYAAESSGMKIAFTHPEGDGE